jgi:Zinc finger, C3HC4 type (RING finger)
MGKSDNSPETEASGRRQSTRSSERSGTLADCTAWLTPNEPTRQLPDGCFVRPAGRPPVDGYTWNHVRGVWVPGKRLQMQMEDEILKKLELQAKSQKHRSKRNASRRDDDSDTLTLESKNANRPAKASPVREIGIDTPDDLGVEESMADSKKSKKKGQQQSRRQPETSVDRKDDTSSSFPHSSSNKRIRIRLAKDKDPKKARPSSMSEDGSHQVEEKEGTVQSAKIRLRESSDAEKVSKDTVKPQETAKKSFKVRLQSGDTDVEKAGRSSGKSEHGSEAGHVSVISQEKAKTRIKIRLAERGSESKRPHSIAKLDPTDETETDNVSARPEDFVTQEHKPKGRKTSDSETGSSLKGMAGSARPQALSIEKRVDSDQLVGTDREPNTIISLSEVIGIQPIPKEASVAKKSSAIKLSSKPTDGLARGDQAEKKAIDHSSSPLVESKKRGSHKTKAVSTLSAGSSQALDDAVAVLPQLPHNKDTQTTKSAQAAQLRHVETTIPVVKRRKVIAGDRKPTPASSPPPSSIPAGQAKSPSLPANEHPTEGFAISKPSDRVDPVEERNESMVDVGSCHPSSEWEEPHPGFGQPLLTLYDQHRPPRPIPTGLVSCSIKALQQEFQCTICLGYIRSARLVSECLHRFCEQCIEKALEQVGRRNECPICRTFIPSRRSLAPDPSFDLLIDTVLGKEGRAREEEFTSMEELQPIILQRAIQRKKRASETEAEHKKLQGVGVASSSQPRSETEKTNPVPSLVKLELLRSPDETILDDLRQPYLTISGDAPIRVVQGFLKQKLGFVVHSIEVMSMFRGQPKVLSDQTSLQTVAAGMTDSYDGLYMPLFYRGKAPKMDSTDLNEVIVVS